MEVTYMLVLKAGKGSRVLWRRSFEMPDGSSKEEMEAGLSKELAQRIDVEYCAKDGAEPADKTCFTCQDAGDCSLCE